MGYEVRGQLELQAKFRKMNALAPLFIKEFAEEESKVLVREIRWFTPTKTRRLWRSIRPMKVVHVPGTKTWHTGAYSNLDYASYVNDGTPPHIIRAKGTLGALKFMYRGVPRYAPYVKHPGTPAFRMFEKGAFTYRRWTRRRFHPIFVKWKVQAGFLSRNPFRNV